MAIVKTTQKSLLDNLMGSILAVPIGILLFLASFVVLFQSEGCTNLGEVAAASAAGSGSGWLGKVMPTGGVPSRESITSQSSWRPIAFMD